MSKKHNLAGEIFGRLTVVESDHVDERGRTYWLCECNCSQHTQLVVREDSLLRGNTTSCGCKHRESARNRSTKHGLCGTPLHNAWKNMMQRCENPHDKQYRLYGGRGVRICENWHNFEYFKNWALDNGYEVGLTIDRRNNNEGYDPDNCRWVSQVTQQNNRRNNHRIEYCGENRTIAEWARLFNVNYKTLWNHVKQGDMRDFEKYFGGE